MRRHLLRESEPSDKVLSYLGRKQQTNRQSSLFPLMKAVDKATNWYFWSIEKATK
jgi:hypothetical protein